jgi:SAM-dependent methyltransferase
MFGKHVDYVVQHKQEMIGVIARHAVSKACTDYIFSAPESIYGASTRQESWESRPGLDVYVHNHYAQTRDDASVIRGDQSFYDRILCEIKPLIRADNGLFLDVGCSVGGCLHRFSPYFKVVMGIEISFSAAILAHHILSGKTGGRVTYLHHTDAQKGRVISFGIEERLNASITLADAAALPFRQSVLDFVLLSNVIDISATPGALIKEAVRVTKNGGFVCTISPYYWRPDRTHPSRWIDAPTYSSGESMKHFLAEFGLSTCHEVDGIPWVLRFYDRYFQVWMCHMLVSRVQKPG